jgi:hypothetical protein
MSGCQDVASRPWRDLTRRSRRPRRGADCLGERGCGEQGGGEPAAWPERALPTAPCQLPTPPKAERGLGVEAASCRFVRKGGGGLRDRRLCRRLNSPQSGGEPAAWPERALPTAPCQLPTPPNAERGLGVEAASCRFVRKGGGGLRDQRLCRHLDSPQSGRMPGSTSWAAKGPSAACALPTANCQLRRRRNGALA